MSNRTDHIREHVSDQLALERHILEAVERQREDDAMRSNLDANKIVIEIERVLKEHTSMLENLADQYEAESRGTLKKAVTEVAGTLAGLYGRIRNYQVSRMLRDDYTALSLAAMGYTAFHTFGLTIKEDRIADVALRHLKDITPLLVELSRVLPLVVAQETVEEGDYPMDHEAGRKAVEHTHEAWSANWVNTEHV
ncbi:MAG TPA: hypothetical protein VFG50_16110 [Rhodothermales bacterium]|nr:hypothetical protein [Rhodothermales bacterium]